MRSGKANIYLDYNATAPLHPAALGAMQPWLGGPYNASSIHRWGREARASLEASRAVIAGSLQVEPASVLFTASGTEANNLAIRGVKAGSLLCSAVEHASVLATVETDTRPSARIPVDRDGVVQREALQALLAEYADQAPLVSIMLANNETGVIQPIAEIAAIAHDAGALLHVDATQAFGKIPVSMPALGADLLTVAGHKCGGAVGAAALVVNGCLPLEPMLRGGGQELRRRAGTENIAAIAGFAATAAAFPEIQAQLQQLAGWRDAMESALLAHAPGAQVMGRGAERLPTTSCITMPGVENATQLMHFDLEGIAVSSGSACTSGKVEPSHVLAAMGVAPEVADTAIRISGGWASTEAEFQRITEVWQALYDRLGAKNPRGEQHARDAAHG